MTDKIPFSFGWFALKLLGQNLYSNAWAAISELVANGFDAGAKDVYVYIDITQKHKSRIEIFDDGTGMDIDSLHEYAVIGRNRRERDILESVGKSEQVMGRKGIGKLAALYLSENYYLVTKVTKLQESAWHMVYDESRPREEKPFLSKIDTKPDLICDKYWNKIDAGTLLQMNDVNLSGLGEAAFESLRQKLSNYFSLDSMRGKRILLCVETEKNGNMDFEVLTKRIAFGNMAFINYNPDDSEEIIESIESVRGKTVLCAYPKIKDRLYEHRLETNEFNHISMISLDGSKERALSTIQWK